MKTINFLGTTFSDLAREELYSLLENYARDERYRYVIALNVDCMVKYHGHMMLGSVFNEADIRICDSRVLQALAGFRGFKINVNPGSDVVFGLLEGSRFRNFRIAICGPTREQFERLRDLRPDHKFVFFEVPHLTVGSPAWMNCLSTVAAGSWDIALLGFSFPKQEIFAHELSMRRHSGVALCVGASIDFLTGKQSRAPKVLQSLRLEWLYRLLTNPLRLWRRYLIEDLRIFRIYYNVEVKKRGGDVG